MDACIPTRWLDLDVNGDLTPVLTPDERLALGQWLTYHQLRHWPGLNRCQQGPLQRLIHPIALISSRTGAGPTEFRATLWVLLTEMSHRQTPWWTWSQAEWIVILGSSLVAYRQRHGTPVHTVTGRQLVLACAYIPGNFTAFSTYGPLAYFQFANRIFGTDVMRVAHDQVATEMKQMGLGATFVRDAMPLLLAYAFLLTHSAKLTDLSLDLLEELQTHLAPTRRRDCVPLSRVLCRLECLPRPLPPYRPRPGGHPPIGVNDTISSEWADWCARWRAISTEAPLTRKGKYKTLMKIGRWLTARHPDVTSPAHWTREVASEWVATVERMVVGEWAHPNRRKPVELVGKPLRPTSKVAYLAAIRTFLLDCQEWGWIPGHLNPRRYLRTPRSVRSQLGPNPRIIADDLWAKLMSAGLTLTDSDLPRCKYGTPVKGRAKERELRERQQSWYPVELVRALTLTWLFGGLRSDEIQRLRVGCIRWQMEKGRTSEARSVGNEDTGVLPGQRNLVCLLEVPVNKTGKAFVKPVDRLMGEAIDAWERVRPPTVAEWDTKTGEMVQWLFKVRGQRIGHNYLNGTLIPLLCRKAGVPEADARGRITSHRARSTIATQLYNAREPMSLFELQAWLGHDSPDSTQHYAKITPTKLTQAYQDAGYFDRNIRMIEVLLDQQAIQSGAAAKGDPWKYYDLGHGYCTYDFFDQCPHRMACAKCSFYRPKMSAKGQLVEGKAHLQRLLQAIPLLDDERAAVEDTVGAMDALLHRLADIPTPDDGQSPLFSINRGLTSSDELARTGP